MCVLACVDTSPLRTETKRCKRCGYLLIQAFYQALQMYSWDCNHPILSEQKPSKPGEGDAYQYMCFKVKAQPNTR